MSMDSFVQASLVVLVLAGWFGLVLGGIHALADLPNPWRFIVGWTLLFAAVALPLAGVIEATHRAFPPVSANGEAP